MATSMGSKLRWTESGGEALVGGRQGTTTLDAGSRFHGSLDGGECIDQTAAASGGDGMGKENDELADGTRGDGQAGIGAVPDGHLEEPVVDDDGDEFGVEFTERGPGVCRLPFVDEALVLPEFEEQFDLPTDAQEGERLRNGQQIGWSIGDHYGPTGQQECGGGHGLLPPARFIAQSAAPLVGDARGDRNGQEATEHRLARAERNRFVERRR